MPGGLKTGSSVAWEEYFLVVAVFVDNCQLVAAGFTLIWEDCLQIGNL